MSKGCRDPSDIMLKRNVFTGKCDCKCENKKLNKSALGWECSKCGHIQTNVNLVNQTTIKDDKIQLTTFVELMDKLQNHGYEIQLQLGVYSGGLLKTIDTEKNAQETLKNIRESEQKKEESRVE